MTAAGKVGAALGVALLAAACGSASITTSSGLPGPTSSTATGKVTASGGALARDLSTITGGGTASGPARSGY